MRSISVLTIPQATLPADLTLLDRAADVRPKLGALGLPLIPRREVTRSRSAPQSHADHHTRVACLEPARHHSPLCLVESQSLHPEQARNETCGFRTFASRPAASCQPWPSTAR